MKYKVMIVEDQTMPRELFELRVQASERFELALSIDNAALADVYCLRFPVDLILMDVITRDGENGLDAAARIKRAFPQIKIIIVTSMPECSYLSRAREIGVESFWYKEEQRESLLDVMERPLDARILGKQIIREILYHVLIGPCGGALLALVSRQTHFSLISRVLKRIESQYTENLSVDQLAAEANMSVSAFHHNFKSVTSTSPLQYLKTYRLHKARMLMIHDGMKASAAAMRVGYESASQFSREFKRYFGITPGEDAARIRMMQGV